MSVSLIGTAKSSHASIEVAIETNRETMQQPAQHELESANPVGSLGMLNHEECVATGSLHNFHAKSSSSESAKDPALLYEDGGHPDRCLVHMYNEGIPCSELQHTSPITDHGTARSTEAVEVPRSDIAHMGNTQITSLDFDGEAQPGMSNNAAERMTSDLACQNESAQSDFFSNKHASGSIPPITPRHKETMSDNTATRGSSYRAGEDDLLQRGGAISCKHPNKTGAEEEREGSTHSQAISSIGSKGVLPRHTSGCLLTA